MTEGIRWSVFLPVKSDAAYSMVKKITPRTAAVSRTARTGFIFFMTVSAPFRQQGAQRGVGLFLLPHEFLEGVLVPAPLMGLDGEGDLAVPPVHLDHPRRNFVALLERRGVLHE